ncbi:hypothetical protein O3G_MSEX006959 [Manduca sexta]|uniref:MADF domain-containing protein n=1 Tax=Manduca sexta TaxID=7130 RepID=A0A921Z5G0_MANSE|nr:hypothetical protein O3G_MSEX006959 [Manduca sexta]
MANSFDDLDHSDIHKIIAEMKSEPCLYDPKAQYYKNAKKRKEAYARITARVNEGATKQYTVEDIMASVKNLRQKYRQYRIQRMNKFLLYKEMPTAHKWWVMLHRFVKDEDKITQNVLTDACESKKETQRRFDHSVKLYMKAEKRYMADLSSDEDTTAEENSDDSDGEAPAAKKTKVEKNG